MQAFRASATIDSEGELHLDGVPFRPGSTVEVIVLEPSPQTAANTPLSSQPAADHTSSASATPVAKQDTELSGFRPLVEEQYRLAAQYPEEYIVLVKDRIIHHSPNRQHAFQAYDQAFLDFPASHPVIVEPGDVQKRPPIFRGRSLKTRLVK